MAVHSCEMLEDSILLDVGSVEEDYDCAVIVK
jgi:hypothetical protein